jgi:tripartite-type tricarboxylate transporter receptor subunit TctC
MNNPFVAENIPGANSNIGAAAAARAAPDGYTLLVSTDALPSSALTYANLPFDALRDIQMFGTIARAVFILSVNPNLPAQTAEEFVKLARAKPGSLAYGTSGIGSPHHLVMEMFAQANGLELLHVPYKGSGETVAALLGGVIQSAMGLPSSFTPHVRSGKFRALAVTSAKRSASFPDIPSISERQVKPVEYESWWGLFAPRNTPRPVLERLHAELGKVLQDKAYAEPRLAKIGLEAFESPSVDAAAAVVQTYYERLAPVIKKAGIKAE